MATESFDSVHGFAVAHDATYRFHSKSFRMSVEQSASVHYAGMALFKIGIILVNLVMYIALRIIGWACGH